MLLEFYNYFFTVSLSGQRSADDEPAAKKPKMSVPKKQDPPEKPKTEQRPSRVPADQLIVAYSPSDVSVPHQPSSMEDQSSTGPVVQAPMVIPALSSVTISRRDPRTASHRTSAPLTQTEPDSSLPVAPPVSVLVATPLPSEAPVVDPKGPLPMPPPAPVSLPKPVMPKQVVTSAESRTYGGSIPR